MIKLWSCISLSQANTASGKQFRSNLPRLQSTVPLFHVTVRLQGSLEMRSHHDLGVTLHRGLE